VYHVVVIQVVSSKRLEVLPDLVYIEGLGWGLG